MKQKQRRQKNKERHKNKEPKESKTERQEGRKKENNEREREIYIYIERERETERDIERVGCQKRQRRNKGRHSQINKQCPFLGGKGFFLKSKERKGGKQNKQKIRRV